jgi:hypothetical protein
MARFTHRHVDLDPPVDEAPSPPVVPAPPSTTPPEEAPPPTETPSASPSIVPSSSGLGATLNNATPAPVGSLGQNPVESSQGLGSINHNTNDLTTVRNGLLADVNAGQFSGAALGHVQAILSDINTAISAANASANGGGTLGSVANAEQALRADHLDIINTVNTVKADAALSSLAAQTGANGAATVPGTLPEGTTAATAPHANLAEIGAIFNDAADKILAGVNDGNRQEITDDINAVITDMEALMTANPQMFSGLTGVHADAVVRQLQLELTYINDPSISPDAGHASTDNILDIIDLIQGDTNLADMATQGGISGFSPFPGAENPTPIHLDNGAQTVFWANFIAQSNSLGQQAIDLVGSGDTQAIATLIDNLKAFEKYVTAQGGNELLGATGTLGGEIAAMIKGLQTGDANLVTAVADQMHGNAADVGGNNVPVTGGTYNTDGATVAEVLGTLAAATPPAAETPAATAAAADTAAAHAVAPTISVESAAIATADITVGVADHDHSPAPELHHLHHMWG